MAVFPARLCGGRRRRPGAVRCLGAAGTLLPATERRRGCGGPSGEDGAGWGAGGAFGFAENPVLPLLQCGFAIRVGHRGLWRKAAFCLLVVRGFGGFGSWLLRPCVIGGRTSIRGTPF